MYISCNYSIENYSWLRQKLENYPNVIFVNQNTTPEEFEIPTLINLKNVCDSSDEDLYILYLHHKGVTRVWSKPVNNWRDMLNYFNITNWRTCISKLNDGFDTVGVNWNGDYKYPHYAGNFWWAKSEYIKKLPKLKSPKDNNYRSQLNLDYDHHKQDAEFWIGINNPKACCLHHSNINHYETQYHPYMYMDDTIPSLYNNIPGSFNYEDMKFYKQIVDISPENSYFVEINPEGGKSTAYLIKYFHDIKKNITLDVLASSENLLTINNNLKLLEQFYTSKNIHDNVSTMYRDNSIDFVFIYHACDRNLTDIITDWIPKIKSGGIIAGYNFFTVENARCISQMFKNFEVRSCCWYVFKE